MNTKVYVDNLAAATTADDLMNLFSAYGNVVDVNLTVNRNDPKPRGFAFVTMVTPEGARAVIQALHGKQIATRTLIVTEVRPPSPGPAGPQPPPKPLGQSHRCLPILKKNGVIPTISSPDDGKAQ